MSDQQKATEDIIFDAACQVFQRKGYAGARMQEIADEADINKSMLHYYYRSKKKLFRKVYQRQLEQFFPILHEVLEADKPIDEKITQTVDVYYKQMREKPKLVQFITMEMNLNPQLYKEFIDESKIHIPSSFFEQINEEIEAGNMDRIDPRQLWLNIASLIIFPFSAPPMPQKLFELSEAEYWHFLDERKETLSRFILNGINYHKQ